MDACHYNSFIFPDYFLRFYLGSPAEQIVSQITSLEDFPVFPIVNVKENIHKTISGTGQLSEMYSIDFTTTAGTSAAAATSACC